MGRHTCGAFELGALSLDVHPAPVGTDVSGTHLRREAERAIMGLPHWPFATQEGGPGAYRPRKEKNSARPHIAIATSDVHSAKVR